MERAKVRVPADVQEGLEAVRLSGKTNMLECARQADAGCVRRKLAVSRWGVRPHTPRDATRGAKRIDEVN